MISYVYHYAACDEDEEECARLVDGSTSGTSAVCFMQFGRRGYPSSRSVLHPDLHPAGSDPGLSTCIAAINLRKRPC